MSKTFLAFFGLFLGFGWDQKSFLSLLIQNDEFHSERFFNCDSNKKMHDTTLAMIAAL